jgi:hypothetical protein
MRLLLHTVFHVMHNMGGIIISARGQAVNYRRYAVARELVRLACGSVKRSLFLLFRDVASQRHITKQIVIGSSPLPKTKIAS